MTKRSTKNKTLQDLESNECRWPIGDPRHADFHFCGARQAAGRPYCQHHWDMSYTPPKSRQQPSVPVPTIKQAA
ncbi:MAG: GcrA family cell cycle regulator [Hyphomicrobiaceae bacterium]